MRRFNPLLLLPVLMSATAAGAQPVAVDAPTRQRLELATWPLARAAAQPMLTGFAHVLDPTPLMTLDGDLVTAAAAAAASAAEERRSRALAAADATISRRAAEAATAQARSDAAKLLLLRRRLALEWGGPIAAMTPSRRAALIDDLVAGRRALFKIDPPVGGSFDTVDRIMVDIAGHGSLTVRPIGNSRTADPRQAAAGKLAIASGAIAGSQPIGLTLPVRLLQGRPIDGVIVPTRAIIRYGGKSWAYVERGPGRFERRMITAVSTQPEGLIVRQGFAIGDRVVVHGSAQLLTAEMATGRRED